MLHKYTRIKVAVKMQNQRGNSLNTVPLWWWNQWSWTACAQILFSVLLPSY